jgi:hypothetical protein
MQMFGSWPDKFISTRTLFSKCSPVSLRKAFVFFHSSDSIFINSFIQWEHLLLFSEAFFWALLGMKWLSVFLLEKINFLSQTNTTVGCHVYCSYCEYSQVSLAFGSQTNITKNSFCNYFGFLSNIFLIFWNGRSNSSVRSTEPTLIITISGTSTCNKEFVNVSCQFRNTVLLYINKYISIKLIRYYTSNLKSGNLH